MQLDEVAVLCCAVLCCAGLTTTLRMAFQFIEALIRLVTLRYRPRPPPAGARVRVVGARRPAAAEGVSRRTKLTNMGATDPRNGGASGGVAEQEFSVSGIARRVKVRWALLMLVATTLVHPSRRPRGNRVCSTAWRRTCCRMPCSARWVWTVLGWKRKGGHRRRRTLRKVQQSGRQCLR